MLIKPILQEVPIFNAGNAYTFKFRVNGGERIVANKLTITRVSDNYIVYSQEKSSITEHTLPSNTLLNGVSYRAQVMTKGETADDFGQYPWSAPSNIQLFWCYFPPTLTILNIEEGEEKLVRHQTFTFKASYKQLNNEPIQSYRFLLYHADKSLFRSFEEHFLDGFEERLSDGSVVLTQEISDLVNEREYYVEVISNSANDHVGTSGLILFRARYDEPNIAVTLDVKNREDEGAIQISSTIIQILLTVYDEYGDLIEPINIQYNNGSAIDLNRSDYQKIVADTGLYLTQEKYSLQLWISSVEDETVFLKTVNNNGRMEVFKKGNKIVAKKYLNGLDGFAAYASNELANFTTQGFTLLIRNHRGALDLVIDYV